MESSGIWLINLRLALILNSKSLMSRVTLDLEVDFYLNFSSKKSWTCHAIHGRIPGSSIGISKLIQLVSITKNNNVL